MQTSQFLLGTRTVGRAGAGGWFLRTAVLGAPATETRRPAREGAFRTAPGVERDRSARATRDMHTRPLADRARIDLWASVDGLDAKE